MTVLQVTETVGSFKAMTPFLIGNMLKTSPSLGRFLQRRPS
jgi:hypothetical protein